MNLPPDQQSKVATQDTWHQDALVRYDATKRCISLKPPGADCLQDLGFVTTTFTMHWSPYDGPRWYSYDRGTIAPYENFRGRNIISIMVTKDNVESLKGFIEDRDDFVSARNLRKMFPGFFPKESRLRAAWDALLGRA